MPARAEFAFQKKISLYIGYTPGGSYDLYGRLVTRHRGRFLPDQPTVVPQNMPGAGSLNAANYVCNIAPKDGTALGVVVETLALEQNLRNPAAQYDRKTSRGSDVWCRATTCNWSGIPRRCNP